jgi:hypothetical protein
LAEYSGYGLVQAGSVGGYTSKLFHSPNEGKYLMNLHQPKKESLHIHSPDLERMLLFCEIEFGKVELAQATL